MKLRRLDPVQIKDVIERLAEHAISSGLRPKEISRQFERRYFQIILEMNGNQSALAKGLGIHRNTLSSRLRKLGVYKRGYMQKHGNRFDVL